MDADLYVPGDGWLHRADPRVKFLISVAMLVLCLVWRNWMFIAAILVIEHIMLVTDHVPAERIAWVWKILALIIVLIVVLWPIFDTSGTHVLWRWGWLRLTQENLLMAAVMGLRIPALGFACFITLFTTDQPKFIRGLVSLGVPYKAPHPCHRATVHSGVFLHLPVGLGRTARPRARSQRQGHRDRQETQCGRTHRRPLHIISADHHRSTHPCLQDEPKRGLGHGIARSQPYGSQAHLSCKTAYACAGLGNVAPHRGCDRMQCMVNDMALMGVCDDAGNQPYGNQRP